MGERQGKRSGAGLKPVLNSADTGSVVNTVKGYVALGRQRASGNSQTKNNMVSANASKRGK